jgi:beta-galactosidase
MNKTLLCTAVGMVVSSLSHAATKNKFKTDEVLFGAAYYDEYSPHDRLDKDIKMMKDAGINIVRIAESTWSTVEPQEGVYDFHHIDRVLDAMHQAGIRVIIGTPTYALPTWLVKKYPDVLAVTPQGQNKYGTRQNMDITNPHFREHAEIVIRKMLEHVKDHPAVIGYQVDNETKHYNTSGPNVQKAFVAYMKNKYPDLNELNKKFGLDYWSNRINSWDDFPEVQGSVWVAPTSSINASLTSEFAKFQRQLVTDYLAWQVAIVNEYKKPEQFVTQNFDFEWRGYSFGIQPDVDHFAAAKAMDVAGVDIYHPTQDHLTGTEISFGGDVARSMKNGKNYFVIETQAQGFSQWTPYPGQLRLQAFSHLASGANMVAYWHWSSLHNAVETYWKGLLSHDFEPNPTYDEAKTIGNDLKKFGSELVNLQKDNKVAILFSNEAQTAFNQFSFGWGAPEKYNDILRPFYDSLYRMNVGVDFIDPSNEAAKIGNYKLVVVPALYAASDSLLTSLNEYVKKGGHVVYTFKSGFSDENVKVRSTHQPGVINESAGVYYSQFVTPENVTIKGNTFGTDKADNTVKYWMELIKPTTAKVLATYEHPVWGQYAAVTENKFGKGLATYIGFMPSDKMIEGILSDALKKANVWGDEQKNHFPIITKNGRNSQGGAIHYIFNYSSNATVAQYDHEQGVNLFNGKTVAKDTKLSLAPWDVVIIKEQ